MRLFGWAWSWGRQRGQCGGFARQKFGLYQMVGRSERGRKSQLQLPTTWKDHEQRQSSKAHCVCTSPLWWDSKREAKGDPLRRVLNTRVGVSTSPDRLWGAGWRTVWNSMLGECTATAVSTGVWRGTESGRLSQEHKLKVMRFDLRKWQ